MSEVLGVVLFATALLWFVALASYSPADPAWFFYAGPPRTVGNFAGPVGAFVSESSFQLLGYASFLVPLVLLVAGWHYFWCRTLSAGYTKAIGATLLLLCGAALLALSVGTVTEDAHEVLAGGPLGA
ncbi:MAG: DNA translocase FtsK 4TM domain-containing protein, partial [Vicinamibacteria bacterium]